LIDHLDNFGDLSIRDVGARTPRRLLEYRLASPGDPCEQDVEALFREYYDRTRAGDWQLAKYTHEYRDLRRGTRLAYHLHSLEGSPELVPHAHCGSAEADEEAGHLRAVLLELMEANAIFMRLYARDADPDCASFLPLALPGP
jgi:hypothetical protein